MGHLLFLGGIVSASFWVVGWIIGIGGQNLSSTDIRGIYQAGISGNFGMALFGIVLLSAVGTLAIHWATSPKVQEIEHDLNLDKI